MGLLWPDYLLLLAVIPLLVLVYVLVLRRRRRFAVHYSSLSLIRQAMPVAFQWRRHLPFALMALALALLVLALARPFTSVAVASSRTTVMLALDVSLSMCADDVDPNRLTVAQRATERFIDSQEPDTRVGVVAFAGIAQVVVPPTTDREVLLEAVNNLKTARATAVGSAIGRSLAALAEINPDIPPLNVYVDPRQDSADPDENDFLQPDVIVLLTDGASNRGVSPLMAARAARDRGGPGVHHRLRHNAADDTQVLPGPTGRGPHRPANRARRIRDLLARVWAQQLPDAGRADLESRGRDHRRRILRGRERGRASGSLLRDPGATRGKAGTHGGFRPSSPPWAHSSRSLPSD